MNNKIPKVFISYSWDNELHKEWVLNLAIKLRQGGVDVILDVWELNTAGKDKDFFMENSIASSDRVLLIMTPNYKIKAENRKGGVGNEVSMVRAEKFNNQKTEKFIPIVRSGSRDECTPLFVKSLIDIDMSIENNFEKSFEELLRTIYDEPKTEKPPLGKKPQFTKPKKTSDLGISDIIEKSKLYKHKTVKKLDLEFDLNKDDDFLAKMIDDPNKIKVSIVDPAPIVILFGAQYSGKTMAIIRLTRYLQENGYSVEPNRAFRPSHDEYYNRMCDRFNDEVYSNKATTASGNFDVILLRVRDKYDGRIICQILDVSGAHYFDCNEKNELPLYFNQIIHAENKKVWIFLMELDWKDVQTRIAYAEKIVQVGQKFIAWKDKIILMCNKVDKYSHFFSNAFPNKKHFFEDTKNQYPHVFGYFKNRNLITKLFYPYIFDFIVFSAGVFWKEKDMSFYVPSDNQYPITLWKAILKAVK